MMDRRKDRRKELVVGTFRIDNDSDHHYEGGNLSDWGKKVVKDKPELINVPLELVLRPVPLPPVFKKKS